MYLIIMVTIVTVVHVNLVKGVRSLKFVKYTNEYIARVFGILQPQHEQE